MTAYWVARSKINDPVEYRKYTDRVPAIIARFGGRVLAHGPVPSEALKYRVVPTAVRPPVWGLGSVLG